MMRHYPSRHPSPNRPGKTLVMFALLLPLLLGMVGLAIDSGLLLATYRQTQNAADAAATAAAMDLINNLSIATAQATGATYVQTYNNMAGATVTINIPPASGPHAGNTTYAEAIVSYPYKTSFIQLLGVNKNQTVTARAVAGKESVPVVEGILTLQQNPPGGNGLTVSGGATLSVDGPIVVNATTSGVKYTDPLVNLVVPTTSNGVVNTNYGTLSGSGTNQTLSSSGSTPSAVNVNNGRSATLLPGIYQSISVARDSTVTFEPGIYVLAGGGMTISKRATISGSGVMFYNTANNYIASTGADGSSPQFGAITIHGGTTFNLSGITSSGSPFIGMLVFQDRSNTDTITVSGTSDANVSGTFYAPTANVTISGSATYDSQFIVGTMTVTGGSPAINIVPPAPRAPLVYLVE